jgi:(1->4)-alpha-D-glucan 1-alpha-D-glucosylmutase
MDNDDRIAQIVNNYTRMSFNFGPTLLGWMEHNQNEVYQKIIAADKESQDRFSGHGSAIAQVYNHIIMPLANQRDRRTQVIWGIRDFVYHFGRQPEGMWLAETAVDIDTLEILAEHNIRFTILSPRQAQRVRPLESGDDQWHDVTGGRIDPTMPYIQHLPSGRSIVLFFYDDPIAQAVAFERLLSSGERFVNRLMGGFNDERHHPQLVHIATDGESYGHHHDYGDMALAYALQHIETNNIARLTNYGEFLEYHPPTWEVEIIERTSWSCIHGVERWYRDCGCNSGKFGYWNQAWRSPLRSALDWLRDTMEPRFALRAAELLYEPWDVRDDYINLILDRSPENLQAFLSRHATHALDDDQQVEVLKLLELQRQLLLMYTSCGWFFDDISGIETVQILKYAGRVIHLARTLFDDDVADLEQGFLDRLEQAKSNLAEHRDGRTIFEKWVRPAEVDLVRVGAHYAVTSLFERYFTQSGTHDIYCYYVDQQDYHRFEPGVSKVVLGYARITSRITYETQMFCFAVLHFGDNNLNVGVQEFVDETSYKRMVEQVQDATERADIAEVVRLLDGYFGGLGYSIQSLFRDEQRSFLDMTLQSTLADDESIYRQLYERRVSLMYLLTSLQTPLPRTLHAAAEFVLNSDLRHAVAETRPDPEAIDSILERVRMWHIELDTEEFIYTLDQTMDSISRQLLEESENLELIQNLDALVEVVRRMPFDVDLWKIQNTYYEIIRAVYTDMQERADEGEEDAIAWTEQFITLGDKLGLRVTEMHDFSTTPTVASITKEILEQSRVPLATYRFQLNPDFTFSHAKDLVGYLHNLGISHCYTSPIFQARAGSSHGYDVCDHSKINPVLGGEEMFQAFSEELHKHGMNSIVDIVPNHMGIGDVCNQWWMDVLENGPSSAYASYFDIEWHPVKPELANKVLLPILGDQYGRILENGELKLVYGDGAFYIHYWDHVFPVAPGTYSLILTYPLEMLQDTLEAEDEHLLEYQSILTAISYLPPRTELEPEKLIERNREKEVIKRRIDALYQECNTIHEAIDGAVQAFNGKVGDPRSFDLLDELVNDQSYRLAFWRVAAEEINYRRFFDINDLAAIRTEDQQVFNDTHELIFQLLTENKISGLRIDHIDGLYDPSSYFHQLQKGYLFHQVRSRMVQTRANVPDDETLWERISARWQGWMTERLQVEGGRKQEGLLSYPLYVVAEKILSEDEPLPQNWVVHGTTGYDFLAVVNGVFVNGYNGNSFERIYRHFSNIHTAFQDMVRSNKKLIMLVSMDSEIYALSHQLERIAERNRRYRDFTLNMLTFAIREVISSLSVYRTYITNTEMVLARDRQYIEAAVAEAKRQNPRTAEAVFDFIKETLLMQNVPDFRTDDREPLLQWVMKFQQVTGPVMAKGVEDTTFYVYNRLVSLNEVGGHPSHFGSNVLDFHERNLENQRFWPHTMLSTSTHDTKRSEDVRARINVLSEMPETWKDALERWSKTNAACKTIEEDRDSKPMPAPDSNDEYLLYQTLIGAWPLAASGEGHDPTAHTFPLLAPEASPAWDDFRERVAAYMHKATKEAKVYTSWVQPNQGYDTAVREFVYRILDPSRKSGFLADIQPLVEQVAWYGHYNSLAQLLLKLTSPGVPDIYQGTELWNLSLVDPDNRRPVDYQQRIGMLDEMKQRITSHGDDLTHLTNELIQQSYDGRIKLYLLYRTLSFRRTHADLFNHGSYASLEASGKGKDHVCAFARRYGEDEEFLVVVPRLPVGLTDEAVHTPMDAEVWGDSWLTLTEADSGHRYRHHFTGEVFTVSRYQDKPGLKLADVFASFPVALLELVEVPAPTEEESEATEQTEG